MNLYSYPALHHTLTPEEAERAGVKQYTDFLEEHGTTLDEHSAEPLRQMRSAQNGISRWFAHPDERYKYTDLKKVFEPQYGLNINRCLLVAEPAKKYRCGVAGLDAEVVYVVGDVVVPQAGERVCAYGEPYVGAISRAGELSSFLHKYLYRSGAPVRDFDPMAWLNDLLVQDGVFVYVPDGVTLERPVQIVNVSDTREPLMSNRRVFVFLGKGAKADVVLCDHSFGETQYLTTQQVSVFLCPQAQLGLYTVEETTAQTVRFSNFHVYQEAASRLDSALLTLRCGTSRNTFCVVQEGEQVETRVAGAVIADSEEHADNYVSVRHHAAQDAQSDMLFKYVMTGSSTGVFTGINHVEPHCERITSEQQHHSLVLSDAAHVYSRPVLEIYSDDVKCSHGSTVGKLDEAALFYMRQRGIPEAEAQLLLQHAFVNDVIRRIPLPALRERISSLVERRFRGSNTACDGCQIKSHCQ